MRAGWCLGALLLAAATAACTNVPYYCTTHDQCVFDGEQGVCEQDHRCSFRDDECPSRRRYAPYGDESCVPPLPACVVAGVAAGANFSCAWSNLGRVACWGDNGQGQLGDGTSTRSTPRRIESLGHVKEVVAGSNHACALHTDGLVSCWGDNSSSQLGDGTTSNRNSPVRVMGLSQVTAVAAGGRHTCARRQDGSLVCWGRNSNGQLGDGTTSGRPMPTRVAALRNEALDVAAGAEHTCALLVGGATACWGNNRNGAVGLGLDNVVSMPARLAKVPVAKTLSAGDHHGCVVTQADGVTCWGLNDFGQAADRAAGRVVEPAAVAGLAGVLGLDAGAAHTCAILEQGLRCWGNATAAQLGPGLPDGTHGPLGNWRLVAAGLRHTCALAQDGNVFCWGRTGEGQLGDGTPLFFSEPQPVRAMPRFLAVAAGGGHSCALKDGRVLCWGRGEAGQLGNGEAASASTPVAVELPGEAVQVVAGAEFSCARLSDGSVHCWGRGVRGQLGGGEKMPADRPRPGPAMLPERAVHLAAGAEHACAVDAKGAVHCWGETQYNRLGNGVVAAGVQSRPARVPIEDELQQVAAGNAHSCALARGGAVHCWGHSGVGQTGVGPSSTPAPPTVVANLPEATAVVTGADHTCALTTAGEGSVWCWGRGDSGQLGMVSTSQNTGVAQPVQFARLPRVIAVSAAANHTCAVRSDGIAFCWGSNRYGQLGLGPMPPQTSATRPPPPVVSLERVVAIEAGDRHTCAVTQDGAISCWGSNQHGQLGTGAPLERAQPQKVPDTLVCP